MLLGGIEGGGTKFVCAVGDEMGRIHQWVRIPTIDPAHTLDAAITFFKKQEVLRNEPLAAIGIGMFGPVDLNPASEHYGYITTTPKPGWAFTDVVGPVQKAFPDLPVGFDTDVNAAALGEQRWGAAQAWDTFIYMRRCHRRRASAGALGAGGGAGPSDHHPRRPPLWVRQSRLPGGLS